MSNLLGSESERHAELVGSVVVVGVAIVVDIAGIGRVATRNGQQPPVGPGHEYSANNHKTITQERLYSLLSLVLSS